MGSKNPLTGGIESDHELNLESAKRLEQDAQYEAVQRRRMGERLMGEQIAAVAGNNIELSGSALQAIQQDNVEAEIEAMNIVYTGKYKAAELKQRSKNQRQQAYIGLATQAASFAMGAGAFKAGGAVAAGATGASAANGGKGYYSGSSTGRSNSGNLS